MIIIVHKNFEKQLRKLRKSEQKKFIERRDMFMNNSFDPLLNNHALHGDLEGYRSINITGDLRVVFEILDEDTVLFIYINSHSELYK